MYLKSTNSVHNWKMLLSDKILRIATENLFGLEGDRNRNLILSREYAKFMFCKIDKENYI